MLIPQPDLLGQIVVDKCRFLEDVARVILPSVASQECVTSAPKY